MNVSWRHMLAAASAAALAAGGVAVAGPPGGCHSSCSPPPPPPPPSHGCCQTPSNLIVNVPGVSVATANVNVGATSTVVAAAGVSTTLSSGVVVSGGGSAGSIVYGGGGGYYSNSAVPQSSIGNLNVFAEDYCIDKIVEELQARPVQALCIDDANTPHPASRLDDAANVDANYEGEVFRCVAGTHMQVTVGHIKDGKASFDAGDTFSCVKGESLWHSKGGVLQCRMQTPERNCNERSLLRKFGPGVKIVQVATKKNFCEPAGKVAGATRIPRAVAAGSLVLDGGVGQGF